MNTSPEVVRWFTRARRFPQLVGRTPDGARIPGGPYTITQVIGAGLMLLAGTQTMTWWAHYGLLSNALLLLAVTGGVVFGLGKIPVGSRNPISVLTGVLRAVSAPSTGRVAGRPVRLRRPHLVRHHIVVMSAAPDAARLRGAPLTAVPSRAVPAHSVFLQGGPAHEVPQAGVPAAARAAAAPGSVPAPGAAPAPPGRQDANRAARPRPPRRRRVLAAPRPAGSTRRTPPAPAAPSTVLPATALSGVQALLAQTTTSSSATGVSATSPPDPAGPSAGRPLVATRTALEG